MSGKFQYDELTDEQMAEIRASVVKRCPVCDTPLGGAAEHCPYCDPEYWEPEGGVK